MFKMVLPLLLLFALACDQYEEIMTDLTQKEANIILVALRQNSIDAKKIPSKGRKGIIFAIESKKDQAKEALKIIVDNQLPKEESIGLNKIYAQENSNLIPTKSDEQARFLMATQGEIESLIKVLPNIVDVKVVLSTETKDEYSKKDTTKTASVVLVSKNSNDKVYKLEEEIRNIVSSSVANLSKENISVVIKKHIPANYVVSGRGPIAVSKNISLSTFDKSSSKIIAILLFITFLSLCLVGFLLRKTLFHNLFLFLKRS